ncbi:hypothetical protein BK120_08850 [Paenibacillus sp. FSL A5-0031]|uniref:hypothetical protein n=1 Tax=Paenibacillus sp. FSL A5-0031 TaxID=1920420 RepID=UPI00096BE0A7|nr:hypothetical protein [Paenibacillus sp. FSL A5-0031]OME86087.1 hypothetical protein BK120_08850 [Paenibacillus sp. FSL A5-0031]
MTRKYSELYKQQCQNVKLIEDAYTGIEKSVKHHIKTENKEQEIVFTRLLSTITVIWMEAVILKICFDNNAFTNEDVLEIRSAQSLEQRIVFLLNMAMCKNYNIAFTKSLLKYELPYTNRLRYEGLVNLIQEDFSQSIIIRNKIAHGQWKYAYQLDENILDVDITGKLNKENIVDIQLKRNLFIQLMNLIQNVAVDFTTFEEQFDRMYDKIEGYKHNRDGRSYKEYRKILIEKYIRGKKMFHNATQNVPV